MNEGANPTIRQAICAALLAGLCAGLFAAAIGRPLKSAGEWRRTAHGWERTIAWSQTHSDAAKVGFHRSGEKRARLDTHPAALALFQLTAAMLALAIFGPRGRLFLQQTSFSKLLAQSFRASAFGS